MPLFYGPKGTTVLDGGAPFYDTYTCKDGRWMSVGCIEPHFFSIFLEIFTKALPDDFDPCEGWKPEPLSQFKQQEWPKLREYLANGFLTQPRDFWAEIFLGRFSAHFQVHIIFQLLSIGTDACALPVLSPEEADREHSILPSGLSKPIPHFPIIDPGAHTDEILRDLGIVKERIQKLRKEHVFGGIRHNAKL